MHPTPTTPGKHTIAKQMRMALTQHTPGAQAGFTGKELRELLNMPGIAVHLDPEQLDNLTEQDRQELQASRGKRRIFDLMSKAAAAAREGPW